MNRVPLLGVLVIASLAGCKEEPKRDTTVRIGQVVITTRGDLLRCVREFRCAEGWAPIREGVKKGHLDVYDFLAVWDEASVHGRSLLMSAAAPREDFVKLQSKTRKLWTNGADFNLDNLWLRQFTMWEERGRVPLAEKLKLEQAILLWNSKDAAQNLRIVVISECVIATGDPDIAAFAVKRGMPPRMFPPFRSWERPGRPIGSP